MNHSARKISQAISVIGRILACLTHPIAPTVATSIFAKQQEREIFPQCRWRHLYIYVNHYGLTLTFQPLSGRVFVRIYDDLHIIHVCVLYYHWAEHVIVLMDRHHKKTSWDRLISKTLQIQRDHVPYGSKFCRIYGGFSHHSIPWWVRHLPISELVVFALRYCGMPFLEWM